MLILCCVRDWKLYASKWWNWTETRAGAAIVYERNLDCIDTTKLLAGWFTGNHWYFSNKFFKNDIKQALSGVGGLAPKYRNYVVPVESKQGTSFELTQLPYVKPKPEGDVARRLWNKRLSLMQADAAGDDTNNNNNNNNIKNKTGLNANMQNMHNMQESLISMDANENDAEIDEKTHVAMGAVGNSYKNVVQHNVRSTATRAKSAARSKYDEAKNKVHAAHYKLNKQTRQQGYTQLDAGVFEADVGHYVAPTRSKASPVSPVGAGGARAGAGGRAAQDAQAMEALQKIGFMDLLGNDDDDDVAVGHGRRQGRGMNENVAQRNRETEIQIAMAMDM